MSVGSSAFSVRFFSFLLLSRFWFGSLISCSDQLCPFTPVLEPCRAFTAKMNAGNHFLAHLATLPADCSTFHELRTLALARELCGTDIFTPRATAVRLLTMRMFHCFLCNDGETFLSTHDFPLLSIACLDLHELSRFLLEDMALKHERRLFL